MYKAPYHAAASSSNVDLRGSSAQRPLLMRDQNSFDRPPPPPGSPYQYTATMMQSPRSPSFPRQPQAYPSSPGSSPGRTVNSVARGDLGAAYGPYSYERANNSNAGSASSQPFFRARPSNEKFATPPPSARGESFSNDDQQRRFPNSDTGALPVYLYTTDPEDDDVLHRQDRIDQPFVLCSGRGWLNFTALFLLLGGLIGLFAGYPIVRHVLDKPYHGPGFNLGGINGTGQIPDLPGMPGLVDKETPKEALTHVATDGTTYNLVFSDEFNTDGRTFYPGDDPYWEGQDMHYWATGDLEWYSPDALATEDGNLVITMSKTPNHGLDYMSGMLTTWNKFCFTTGYIEVNVSLPGAGSVAGLWPGVWTMGNLGRAGYGATTEGLWPYTYDSCDVGTFPAQMDKSGNPQSSLTDGWDGGQLSNLPGQRLSACTCPGSDHPGPNVGTGRGVPEIDVLEAQVDRARGQGQVSQSYQLAPFNAFVKFANGTPETTIYDDTITKLNTFTGTTLQQGASAVTYVDNANYNGTGFAQYGLEYWSDSKHRDDGYVTWFSEGQKTWTITSASIGPDPVSGVDQRLITEEPMYIILNLGMSPSFEGQDFDHLIFPSKMYIDYVRVYQRADVDEGVTCDPSHHPTTDYINSHATAYTNANWTTWASAGYTFPRNSLYDGCT